MPIRRTTRRLNRPSTPETPTKKVALSLRVADADLDSGLFRTPRTASPESTVGAAATVTNTAQTGRRSRGGGGGRRGRGRPRGRGSGRPRDVDPELSFDTLREAGELVPLDFERWEERFCEREREFAPRGGEEFRAVSALGFPIRVAGMDGRGRDELWNDARVQMPAGFEDDVWLDSMLGRSGADAVPATDSVPPSLTPAHLPATPLSRPDHVSSALRSPWSYFPVRLRRHINPDTNSVADLLILRSGPIPQTVEFWYDVTIGEMAMGAEDLDFKMLCLNLMRWRNENEIAEGLVRSVLGRRMSVGKEQERGRGIVERLRGEYQIDGNDVESTTVWDNVLVDAVVRGKIWRKRRRWMEKEREKAAGWAVWEMKARRCDRGDFVDDGGIGAWILRAPGLDGMIRRILKLGYKRERQDEEFEAVDLTDLAQNVKCETAGQESPCTDVTGDNLVVDDVSDPVDVDESTHESSPAWEMLDENSVVK